MNYSYFRSTHVPRSTDNQLRSRPIRNEHDAWMAMSDQAAREREACRQALEAVSIGRPVKPVRW